MLSLEEKNHLIKCIVLGVFIIYNKAYFSGNLRIFKSKDGILIRV